MNRIIPKKNYIILGLVCLVTILLSFYCVDLYKNSREYQLDQNKRMKVLSEVKVEELQNYILDNHDVILYFSSSRDNTYSNFEESLKTYLLEEDLTKMIAYVDTTNLESSFYTDFAKNYFSTQWKKENKRFSVIPNFVNFSDGEVESMLYMNATVPNMSDVKSYLTGVGIHD